MKILITGVSGFVGPVLAEALKERFSDSVIYGTYFIHEEFLKIERCDIVPIFLDITHKQAVSSTLHQIKPDLIFHLAAQSSASISWKNPDLTFSINVNGTINLLESLREFCPKTKMLIVGTSEEYGIVDNKPITEDSILNPMNPYGISKMTQEKIGQLYATAYDMNILFSRSFNHVGIGQSPVFVIPDWCKQVAEIEKGMKEPVINVGNIDVIRDFSFVKDVVRSYIDIIEFGTSGEVYNVGMGKSYSLKAILEMIIESSETDIQIFKDPEKMRPSENPIIKCNREKLDSINKRVYTPLEQVIPEILDYWRNCTNDFSV